MSTATASDLWPADLLPAAAEPTPAAILRRQGQLLAERTGNAVYGEVQSEQVGTRPSNEGTNEFLHRFLLTSGYVRYTRTILFVRHGLQAYPAQFVALKPDGSGGHEHAATVNSAKELEQILRDTFGRDSVKEVIRSLVAQSRDLDDE